MVNERVPLQAVKGVDVARYMGRWYEIGSIPTRFQPKNAINTRATYTLLEDNTVEVLNETWTEGKRGFIKGKAWKVNPNSDDGILKVQFMVPPFLPIFPVRGDYWIMALDKEDYSYALVGQPSRNALWMLARKTEIDPQKYEELLKIAEDQGYDTSKLMKTEHTNEIPQDDSTTDSKGIWWIKSIFDKN